MLKLIKDFVSRFFKKKNISKPKSELATEINVLNDFVINELFSNKKLIYPESVCLIHLTLFGRVIEKIDQKIITECITEINNESKMKNFQSEFEQ